MRFEIQHKLKAIIEQHGQDVINDHRRVKALLTDYFPHNKREVRVLMMALEEGIVFTLLREGQNVSSNILITKYSQQLHDEFGVDLTLASWAVENWAVALSLQVLQSTSIPTVTASKPSAPSNKVLIGDRYIDNHDGTVTDTKTGLQWKRCAEGQIWTGNGCSGEASKYTWEDALSLSSNFAGKTDWRLPTIDELKSLVLKGETPTIHEQAFPNTPPSVFWSSTPNANYSYYAWGIYFYYGYDFNYYRDYSNLARLVRGGQ